MENRAIAQTLGADANTVGKWRRRFAEHRIDGLYDEPRSGAPRRIGDEDIAQTIRLTLETTPPDATHWSLRAMAAAVGHAPSTIHRIWSSAARCLAWMKGRNRSSYRRNAACGRSGDAASSPARTQAAVIARAEP